MGGKYAREKNANLISKKNEKIVSFDVVSFSLSPRPLCGVRFEVDGGGTLSLLLMTAGMSSSGRNEINCSNVFLVKIVQKWCQLSRVFQGI